MSASKYIIYLYLYDTYIHICMYIIFLLPFTIYKIHLFNWIRMNSVISPIVFSILFSFHFFFWFYLIVDLSTIRFVLYWWEMSQTRITPFPVTKTFVNLGVWNQSSVLFFFYMLFFSFILKVKSVIRFQWKESFHSFFLSSFFSPRPQAHSLPISYSQEEN